VGKSKYIAKADGKLPPPKTSDMDWNMGRSRLENNIYAGKSPSDIPAYSFTEAARYLGIPPATLRSWIVGQYYRDDKDIRRFFKPLIMLSSAAKKKRLLSFTNLVEAHVLCAIRKHYGVPMPRVRNAIKFIQESFGTEHPLIEKEFRTDRVDLFIDKLGTLVTASTKTHQTVIRQALDVHLERIEWDKDGLAARLYPFIRFEHVATAPKVIVIDPRISFGRPIVSGTGVPVDVIVDRFYSGDSPEELAEDYRCDKIQILEAIRCATQKAA
jgi:uncharacterized protein (DUF433 family)